MVSWSKQEHLLFGPSQAGQLIQILLLINYVLFLSPLIWLTLNIY